MCGHGINPDCLQLVEEHYMKWALKLRPSLSDLLKMRIRFIGGTSPCRSNLCYCQFQDTTY